MPRGRKGRLAAGDGRRVGQRGRAHGRRLCARPEAVQGAHRRVRRRPGGVGAHGVGRVHRHGLHRINECYCGQPRGAHGPLVDHEAERDESGAGHHQPRHGRVRGRGHLDGRVQLLGQCLHVLPHRHYRRGREHHDAVLPDHRARSHAVPPPLVGRCGSVAVRFWGCAVKVHGGRQEHGLSWCY